MMKKNLIHTLFFLFISLVTLGQVMDVDLDIINNLKSDTTYIVMKNPEAPEVMAYRDVFLKYLTYSNVKFIDYVQLKNLKKAGNNIIAFTCLCEEGQDKEDCLSLHKNSYIPVGFEFIKYMKNDKKKIFAKIRPIPDLTYGSGFLDVILSENFDGGGYLKDWGPGFLSVYLKNIDILRNNPKSFKERWKLTSDLLCKHSKDTLYIPDDIFYYYQRFKANWKLDDFFLEYKLPYKIVSYKILDNLLLDESHDIFYLVVNRPGVIQVYDSATGYVIYRSIYRLPKSNIFSELQSEIIGSCKDK